MINKDFKIGFLKGMGIGVIVLGIMTIGLSRIGYFDAPLSPEPPLKEVANNCDSNYSACVPKVSYDLDCDDISFSVKVIGSDIHHFDGDNDGWGCENN